MDDLSSQVGALWERREQLSTADGDALVVVDQAIDLLDTGEARVAEIDPVTDEVIVHEWLRQAI
jgi:2,3,4,5-tetrahydropyridine-2-carboxylate N-succinyltransferase